MCVSVFFFFFQAEDGIRDLVRSRGLGDVYKRQILQQRVEHGVAVQTRQAHPDDPRRLLHQRSDLSLSLIHI